MFPTHQRSDQAESVLLAGLVGEQVVARAREHEVLGHVLDRLGIEQAVLELPATGRPR